MKKQYIVRRIVAIVLMAAAGAMLFWPRMVQPVSIPEMEATRAAIALPNYVEPGSFSAIMSDANDYAYLNKTAKPSMPQSSSYPLLSYLSYSDYAKPDQASSAAYETVYNLWLQNKLSSVMQNTSDDSGITEKIQNSFIELKNAKAKKLLEPRLTKEQYKEQRKEQQQQYDAAKSEYSRESFNISWQNFKMKWINILFFGLLFLTLLAVILMLFNRRRIVNIIHTVFAFGTVAAMIVYMVHYHTGPGPALFLLPIFSLAATIVYKRS